MDWEKAGLQNALMILRDNLPDSIKLAYLPSYGRVRLRLTAKGQQKDDLKSDLMKKLRS